jgi:hypothetical protein
LSNKVKFTTPFGVARYPHISSPDTKGKYADDKYKVKLVMPLGSPEAQGFIKQIKEAAVALHGQKGLKLHMPFVEDEDANEAIFTFKTTYQPALFDGRNKPAKGVQVGGGSVIRILGNYVAYEKGISGQFNQVQIKELNGFGTSGFGTVDDGYEYDEADATYQTNDQESTSDKDDSTSNGSALDI